MVSTYNPNKVALVVRGVPLIGFVDGSSITLTADNDRYSQTNGTSGAYVRSRQLGNGGTLTFSLLPNSPSNQVLSGLLNEDKLADTGQFPVIIKDASNLGTVASGVGWVHRAPDLNSPMGGDAPPREWTVKLGTYTQFINGTVV